MKKFITLMVAVFLSFVIATFSYAETLNLAKISGHINVNTATKQELMVLPYIDSDTAQAIINVRSAHGPYSSLRDLLQVKGVDKSTLSSISSYLVLSGSTTIRENVK